MSRVVAEVAFHLLRREIVMTGLDWSVSSEDKTGRCEFPALSEGELVGVHQMPDAFQGEKSRVALIHMINGGLEAEGFKRAIAADPKDDFLPDAHLTVTAVQLVGDVTVFGPFVGGDIGVEQIERDPPHLGTPDLRKDGTTGKLDCYRQRCSILSADRTEGEVVEIVVFVRLLLPARLVEILPEVALLIEQADTHQRNPEVARGLQVVPRQDAESARKDGQALGKAKLRREIGDEGLFRHGATLLLEPGDLALKVRLQVRGHSMQVSQERIVAGGGFELFLLNNSQHKYGIMARGLPQVGVEPAEQLDAFVAPGPTQVVGDASKAFKWRRQRRDYAEGSVGLHWGSPLDSVVDQLGEAGG